MCYAHSNAGSLPTILSLVLRLFGLILISELLCLLHRPINRGQTTSLPTTITWMIVDSRNLLRVRCYLETHCPSFSRLGSTDDFFCVTTSSPISVAYSLFPYSCNPPVSCLVTRHLFGLCTQPICSFWTRTLVVSDVRLHSSPFVT